MLSSDCSNKRLQRYDWWKNFFDQPVKNNLRTCDSIQKLATDPGDGCLLDYDYFKDYYKVIATDLSKQQVLDADPKAIKQINFTGNLFWEGNEVTTMFSIIEEAKETVLDFSQVTMRVLWMCFKKFFSLI